MMLLKPLSTKEPLPTKSLQSRIVVWSSKSIATYPRDRVGERRLIELSTMLLLLPHDPLNRCGSAKRRTGTYPDPLDGTDRKLSHPRRNAERRRFHCGSDSACSGCSTTAGISQASLKE